MSPDNNESLEASALLGLYPADSVENVAQPPVLPSLDGRSHLNAASLEEEAAYERRLGEQQAEDLQAWEQGKYIPFDGRTLSIDSEGDSEVLTLPLPELQRHVTLDEASEIIKDVLERKDRQMNPTIFDNYREKVRGFADLAVGWDSYSAGPTPQPAITATLSVIDHLETARACPEWCIPTSDNSVLLKVLRDDTDYKFEVSSDGEVVVSIKVKGYGGCTIVGIEPHQMSKFFQNRFGVPVPIVDDCSPQLAAHLLLKDGMPKAVKAPAFDRSEEEREAAVALLMKVVGGTDGEGTQPVSKEAIRIPTDLGEHATLWFRSSVLVCLEEADIQCPGEVVTMLATLASLWESTEVHAKELDADEHYLQADEARQRAYGYGESFIALIKIWS